VKKDRPIILLGGGGHARVVAEAALLGGRRVAGLLDDRPDAVIRLGELQIARLGPFEHLSAVADEACIVAVGDLALRRELIGRLAGEAATVVHPSAFVSPSAAVGEGVFVGPGAVVHTLARVGDHAIVNTGAIVEHECEIGENAHVAGGAVLGGAASVGADTIVGLGARGLPGVRVGSGCVVGAGAVVVRDVPDGKTVKGVPAG